MITAEESKRAIVAIHRAIMKVRADKFVFIGGGIVPLLITDPAAAPARPTKDVDVVFAITSASDYTSIWVKLLGAGFTDDMTREKPACALYFGEWQVDILPTQPNIIVGGGNSWFPAVIATAEEIELHGERIWRAAPFAFIATKLEAWADRGRTSSGALDYYHQDMEDIVAVLDGRPELAFEANTLTSELRKFLHPTLARLTATSEFANSLVGHVGGSDQRAEIVLRRLRSICAVWDQL